MVAKFWDYNNLLEYSHFSLNYSGRASMGKAKFYSASTLASAVVTVAYPLMNFIQTSYFGFIYRLLVVLQLKLSSPKNRFSCGALRSCNKQQDSSMTMVTHI